MKEHKEIERAWIIKELPPPELISHNIPHTIYYLFSNKFGEMRVVHREHQKNKYLLTVKSVGDLIRDEWEDGSIPEWVFNIVKEEASYIIHKIRHFVNYNNCLLEIDEYYWRKGYLDGDLVTLNDIQGLIRMECEFASSEEAAEFVLPSWAVEATEVTSDRRFKNVNIAKHGVPK